MMRILFAIPHYYTAEGGGRHGSEGGDAERRGAFERPEKAGAGARKIGLRRPMRELCRIDEKAAGMRVIDPLKHEPLAQSRRHDVALLLDLLQSRGERRVT